MSDKKINVVTVRWWDGYKEDFRATEVRFGSDLLWMRLEDGNNRHIPLRMVRWFGTSIESHQNTGCERRCGVMACKWYAEFEGVCCCGDAPERADICPYEDKENECLYYESEGAE